MFDKSLKSKKQIVLGLFIVSLMCSAINAFAYDYPTGIPHPWVEPDVSQPSRPADWSSEVEGYYYVNNRSGSDSNQYGTPNSPRSTIPNPIPAGSYVEVGGTYDHTTSGVIQVWGNGNGSEWVPNTSGPVWLVGDTNNVPDFVGAKLMISGSYVYLANLRVNSGSELQVGSYESGEAADHVLIRDVDVEGLTSDGTGSIVSVVGLSGDRISDVIVYDSVFHDTGDLTSTSDDDADIFDIGQYTSNIWVLDNTMHTASGGGLQVNAIGGSADTHHIYAGRNHVYNVRQAGLWVKFGTDVVFSENTVHDIITTEWSPSKGMGAQYEPQRFWMINNYIYNVEYGIRTGSTYGGSDWEIYTIGNVIVDAHAPGTYTGSTSWDEACIHFQGGETHYIANNTLINCDAGINLSSTSSSYVIKNNIISTLSESAGNHIWVEYQESETVLDNNLFYQNGEQVRLKAGSNLHNLSSFVSTYNKCGNCSNSNPMFTAATSNNYSLTSSSPAIDAGSIDSSVYDKFLSLYGVSILSDFAGNARVMNSVIDMGAYESDGTITKYPPSPPIINAR